MNVIDKGTISLDDPTGMVGMTAANRLLGGGICTKCGRFASTLLAGGKCPRCTTGAAEDTDSPSNPFTVAPANDPQSP